MFWYSNFITFICVLLINFLIYLYYNLILFIILKFWVLPMLSTTATKVRMEL